MEVFLFILIASFHISKVHLHNYLYYFRWNTFPTFYKQIEILFYAWVNNRVFSYLVEESWRNLLAF